LRFAQLMKATMFRDGLSLLMAQRFRGDELVHAANLALGRGHSRL